LRSARSYSVNITVAPYVITDHLGSFPIARLALAKRPLAVALLNLISIFQDRLLDSRGREMSLPF